MAIPKQQIRSGALIITRTYDAPRKLVWKAWTDPGLVKRWWGPEGFTAPFITIDLRVGGKYLYAMRSPEGKDFWNAGVFREIVPEEKLVATDYFSDEKGNPVPASSYGMSGEWPMEMVAGFTFEQLRGKTRLTIRYEGFPHEEMENARAGWSTSLDKLALVLEDEKARRAKTAIISEKGKQEASVIRTFNASRERLFQAYTDPALMAKWWAPRRFETVVEKLEARAGGSWRILNRDAGGEYWFHGVFHEVSPSRIVWTFEYEGMPGHVLLGIVTFEESDGKTKVTEKSVFESVADRDGMMATGMEEGGYETMDQLAQLVEMV